MNERNEAIVFGRSWELEAIENSLLDSTSEGILIEGEAGLGKTFLANLIHRRRGGGELWLRGDRVIRSVEFGALGLCVDLDSDRPDVLFRVVSALTGDRPTPVVFVDDAHDLDRRSLVVLSQLANDGDIKLVATRNRGTNVEEHPFDDLVADHIIDHVVLAPLDAEAFVEMVEHQLGGIVSQGVLGIVEFHSGRVPGKVRELLDYTTRAKRFLDRAGVWVLDGRDVNYDERARDVTRIDLEEYSTTTREVLELVVLAGEIDVELMLSIGLGEAADALVASGEIRLEHRGRRVYVAVENHISETIRYTVPDGRSRRMYDLVAAGSSESLSDWARMLRMDWALGCGANIDIQDLVDTARVAARIGEWHRALRMLIEVPTDLLEAHELCDLGRLYCEVNQAPIGFDVLAQAVKKARCADVIIDAFAVWIYRDLDRTSPTLTIKDFHVALDRIDEDEVGHCSLWQGESGSAEGACSAMDVATARNITDRLGTRPLLAVTADEEFLAKTFCDETLPESMHMLLLVAFSCRQIEMGQVEEALDLLNHESGQSYYIGTGAMFLDMIHVSALAHAGDSERAKRILGDHPSTDIAYLTARSGPSDLVWSRIHTLDGQISEATRSAHAAVEALEHWNQTAFMAIALAQAAYVSIVGGNVEVAVEYEERFAELPARGPYIDYRRAVIVLLVARTLRTGDTREVEKLHNLLTEAMADNSFGLAVLIRIMLFQHFDEAESEEMCRLAVRGTGSDFRLLGSLGAALRDRDGAALLDIADAEDRTMPELAVRCRSWADRFLGGGDSSGGNRSGRPTKLTVRERQISSLIISGGTNAEIAEELGVRVRTVEGHIYRLFQKLGITRREQAARALQELRSEQRLA